MTLSYKVLWTHTAEKDLSAIIHYIAEDNLIAALTVLGRIKEASQQLNVFPERGRIIPELKKQGIASYRELIISPWRLMYRIAGDQVFVLSVIDGRMNVEDVLLNRFL